MLNGGCPREKVLADLCTSLTGSGTGHAPKAAGRTVTFKPELRCFLLCCLCLGALAHIWGGGGHCYSILECTTRSANANNCMPQ